MQKKYFKLLIVPLVLLSGLLLHNVTHASFSMQNYYKFDGDLTDSSGSGYDLTSQTVDASICSPDATAKIGTFAMQPSGAGDVACIVSTSGAPLDVADGNWSVSTWVKYPSNSGFVRFVDYRNTVGGYFLLAIDDGIVEANVMGNGAIGTSQIGDNAWHLVVLTHSGSTNKIYIDDVLEATHADGSDGPDGNNQLTLRCSLGEALCASAIVMDDFGIINSTLSQDDVDFIWAGGAGNPLDGTPFILPTIDFNAPVNGTTTADFNNWSMDLTSEANGDIVRIYYSTISRGGLYHENEYEFQDERPWNIPYVATGFLVPKHQLLWFPPQSQNATWYAYAELIDPTDQSIIANSGEITFTVNATVPITDVPIGVAPFVPPVVPVPDGFTTSTANCAQYPFISTYSAYITDFPFFATTSPQRVVCEFNLGMGNLAGFVVGYGSWSNAVFGDSFGTLGKAVGSFKTAPPFSLYFNATDGIRNAISSSTPSTYDLKLKLPSWSMGGDAGNTDFTLTTLTSTTLQTALTTNLCNTACATTRKDFAFDWMRVVIWASQGILIVGMVL